MWEPPLDASNASTKSLGEHVLRRAFAGWKRWAQRLRARPTDLMIWRKYRVQAWAFCCWRLLVEHARECRRSRVEWERWVLYDDEGLPEGWVVYYADGRVGVVAPWLGALRRGEGGRRGGGGRL